MAKDIAWASFKRMLADARDKGLVHKINESDLMMQVGIGSIIQLKGADKPDSLRGVAPDLLVLDEVSVMKRDVWEEVLRPATVDKQTPVIFISTPKGYNHFYDLFNMSLKYPGFWTNRRIKTSEAGTILQAELEQARRDMDPRAFRQEFEASFETFGGQVFSDFNRERHVKEFSFQNSFEYYWAMDFGWASPTATGLIQVSPDETVFVIDELRATQRPIGDIVKELRTRPYERDLIIDGKRTKRIDPDKIFCDPAGSARNEALGTSPVIELKAAGLHVHYRQSEIVEGVTLIRKWLRNGKIIIHPRCKNLIQAMEMYRYPDPKGDVQVEVPLKDGISDHWIDQLRYFFVNRFTLVKTTWRAL